MKKLRLLFLSLIIIGSISFKVFAQVSGDYGSKATGNWGTDGTNWLIFGSLADWSDATQATLVPGNGNNVWIRNGHTVTMEASSKRGKNLTIVSGGKLLTSASGNSLTLNGDLTIDGTCGSLTAAPTVQFAASGTISGSGTFYFSKIRPTTNTNLKVTVNMNVTGVGSGSFINCNSLNTFTLEVSATKTLTLPLGGYFG